MQGRHGLPSTAFSTDTVGVGGIWPKSGKKRDFGVGFWDFGGILGLAGGGVNMVCGMQPVTRLPQRRRPPQRFMITVIGDSGP